MSDIKGKSLLALKITEASSARISNNEWRAASNPFSYLVYDLFILLISSF